MLAAPHSPVKGNGTRAVGYRQDNYPIPSCLVTIVADPRAHCLVRLDPLLQPFHALAFEKPAARMLVLCLRVGHGTSVPSNCGWRSPLGSVMFPPPKNRP